MARYRTKLMFCIKELNVKKDKIIFNLAQRLSAKADDDPWSREEWLENLDASRDEDDREVSYEDILREIGE